MHETQREREHLPALTFGFEAGLLPWIPLSSLPFLPLLTSFCLHPYIMPPPPLLLVSGMCVWSAGCGVCLQHDLGDGKTPLLNTDGCSLSCAGVFSSAVNLFATEPTGVSNNLWVGGCKRRWFVPHCCLVPK